MSALTQIVKRWATQMSFIGQSIGVPRLNEGAILLYKDILTYTVEMILETILSNQKNAV